MIQSRKDKGVKVCVSVVECLPSKYGALGSNASTENKQTNTNKKHLKRDEKFKAERILYQKQVKLENHKT